MTRPLQGVRIVEVAGWTFVPAAGALLADLGADVIKVEPPTGDPQRGLANMLNLAKDGINPFLEIPNRGKRSVTVDLRREDGQEVLRTLVKSADVFLTSSLPALRARQHYDVEEMRAANPKLIYVRGSGWGARGSHADTGGYDAAAAWSAGGLAFKLTDADADAPVQQPAAFYDLQGANTIAGAIAMALFHRERTGEGSLVDVSLLATALWTMAPDIVGSQAVGSIPLPSRKGPANPLTNYYRTSDNRWISLVLLQADRFWAEFCTVIDRPDLIADPLFADAKARFENRFACVEELDKTFGARSLTDWEQRLSTFSGVWSSLKNFDEIYDFGPVVANGYLPEVTAHNGSTFQLVAPPMQFDEEPAGPSAPAPETGQHTEEVLLESGLDWDQISAYRESGALG